MALQLEYMPEQMAFRAEVRAWMAAHVPKEPLRTLEGAEGFAQHREWERTLARGNWGTITWPPEYGGRGASLIEWLIFEEEYYRANAPARANQNGIFLLGPTLMEFGSSQQKARFLPDMASGAQIWAQAWSEPQAAPIWPPYAPPQHARGIITSCAATRSGRLAQHSQTGVLESSARIPNPPGTAG
jgi:alkylation response protein AidB-like acyl-CoA dehydrogenase